MKSKILILLMTIIMLVSGCSGSGTLKPVEPTATPTPIVADWLGGEHAIKIVMPLEIESTNPFLVVKKDTINLFNLIYEPLIKLNGANEPIPCLAKSWKVDESGKKWTFIIRDGVYWQNTNREINSQDVIFTLDLMNAVKKNSIHCKVMGYIKNWVRIDDRTLEITTYEPFYGVLMSMDFPILPYDAGYTNGESQAPVPVGTGPYYVSDYRPGTRVELLVNDNWWKETPEIDAIVAEPYDNPDLAISALTLGQIDVMQTDDIAVTQIRERGNINAFEYTSNYYEFIIPNIEGNILLRDKKVRQAIALGLDRQEIISNVYVNHAVITESPVQPSSWLYEGTANGYDRDVAEAKRLLTLAGWKKENPEDPYYNISPDGVHTDFSLVLVTNNSEYDSLRYESAHFITKQLAEIGIKIEVKTVDWEMFNTRISEGYYDLLLAGWYVDDIPDFRSLFSTGGANNLSGYSSQEMDDLLDDVMKQYTDDGLRHSFMQLQNLLLEDVPIISMFFRTNTLLTRGSIVGITDVKDSYAFNTIQDWEILD